MKTQTLQTKTNTQKKKTMRKITEAEEKWNSKVNKKKKRKTEIRS